MVTLKYDYYDDDCDVRRFSWQVIKLYQVSVCLEVELFISCQIGVFYEHIYEYSKNMIRIDDVMPYFIRDRLFYEYWWFHKR